MINNTCQEIIKFHYLNDIQFNNTSLNVIGSTTDSVLRTIPSNDDTDTKYVRKFGKAYPITQVTDMADPPTNFTFTVKALDGTVLGSRANGGAFTAGATLTTAQTAYIEAAASGGVGVTPGPYIIDTDVDPGGISCFFSGESIPDTESRDFHISDSGSTYYESSLVYGLASSVTDGKKRTPFRNITNAYLGMGGAFDKVIILDSQTYDERLTLNTASTSVIADLGQTPKLINGRGARDTRTPITTYDNTNATFFNENGDDGTGDGTWQNPYENPAFSITNRGTNNVVYGGIGATNTFGLRYTTGDLNMGAGAYNLDADFGYILRITGTVMIDASSQKVSGVDSNASVNSGIVTVNTGIDHELTDLTHITSADVDYSIRMQQAKTNSTDLIQDCVLQTAGTEGFSDTSGGTIAYLANGTGNVINIFSNELKYIGDSANSGGRLCVCIHDSTTTSDIRNNIFEGRAIGTDFAGIGLAGGHDGAGNTMVNVDNNIFLNLWIGAKAFSGTTTFVIMTHNIVRDVDTAFQADSLGQLNFDDGNVTNFNTKIAGPGGVFINNEVTGEPLLINDFYIQPLSVCWKSGTDSDDLGLRTRLVDVSANDIAIDGLIIDASVGSSTNIRYSASVTGGILRWLDLINSGGTSVDLWDSDTFTIEKINANNNGVGIATDKDGSIDESLIYLNLEQGFYSSGLLAVNHCVFFINKYGLYAENVFTVTNTAFDQNSLFGFFSSIGQTTNFCNHNDAVSAVVDITASSNLQVNPLFINTNPGEENFNIKTIEAGFSIDSGMKDNASDGKDIGAYLLDRSKSSDSWRLYELDFNPADLNINDISKGFRTLENAFGDIDLYAKNHKRVLPFRWRDNNATTEEQTKTISYFTTIIPTRQNGLKKEQSIFRIHLQPDTFLATGTDAIVDATAKTLTDSTLDLVDDCLRGWHMGVKYFNSVTFGSLQPVDYTSSGTDVLLDSPDDTDFTTSQLWPCTNTFNSVVLNIGDYQWSQNIGIINNPSGLNPSSSGTAYGQINFSTGGSNWGNFSTSITDGLNSNSLPKGGTNNLGGSFEYYYDNTAWVFAFNGNTSNIVIAQNGSVYKGSISNANLVIRWDGMTGPAGAASPQVAEDIERPQVFSASIDGGTKVLTTATDPVWTTDEWVGYFVYNECNYYVITSNTNDTLTLSDPLGTLTTQTSVDFSIDKYFKIDKNTQTVFTLEDDDNELIDGTYDWYVDFIECKVQQSSFSYKQFGFDFNNEESKTGYNITFEER